MSNDPRTAALIAELRDLQARTSFAPGASEASRTLLSRVIAALATIQASAGASQVAVHHTGQWRTDEIGANLYCSSFAHDLKLSISGDFEDREARKDCADELVKILNTKFAATQARPVSGEAWISVLERVPQDQKPVLVTSTSWDKPKVLVYEIRMMKDGPWERFIDNDTGRWYWYPERMHWCSLPAAPTSTASAAKKD